MIRKGCFAFFFFLSFFLSYFLSVIDFCMALVFLCLFSVFLKSYFVCITILIASCLIIRLYLLCFYHCGNFVSLFNFFFIVFGNFVFLFSFSCVSSLSNLL